MSIHLNDAKGVTKITTKPKGTRGGDRDNDIGDIEKGTPM